MHTQLSVMRSGQLQSFGSSAHLVLKYAVSTSLRMRISDTPPRWCGQLGVMNAVILQPSHAETD